jgi:hypothetical protein
MRPYRLSVAVLALLVLGLSVGAGQDSPEIPRNHDFGLLGIAVRDDLTVRQGGMVNADGEQVVMVGDRLHKFHGVAVDSLEALCRAMYATRPGQEVEVEFTRRNEVGEWESHTVTVRLADRHELFADIYRHVDLRQRAFNWREHELVLEGGPLRDRVWPLIEEHELEADWYALVAAHERELDLWDAYESTSAVELLLTEPLAAHQFMEVVSDAFAEAARAESLTLPHAMLAKLMDTAPDVEPVEDDMPRGPASWPAIVEGLLASIDTTRDARKAAGPEAWALLDADIANFQQVGRGGEGYAEFMTLVHRMRLLELNHAPALANLTRVLGGLEDLARRAWEAAQAGDVLPRAWGVDVSTFVEGDAIAFQTEYGVFAIGGPGNNIWRGGDDGPAVIVDLGGDNEFINVGVATGARPVSIVISGDGNDRFRSTGPWGVGAGRLGTGVVLSHGGNNTYECPAWGIGAAFGGIGLVIDKAGNDRYLGGDYTIGCAAYGVGGVIDLAGNDLYDSHIHSIGSGQPGGVGFVLNADGDDRYRCGGKYPSGYGTEGEYQGWGIGSGYGWRGAASGGIGLVIDLAGNDIYDAGEFGLGCGYYLGVGMVRDFAGDDIYHASRYGLATGAHCAVGLFMDDSGNDVYEGKTAANMAGVWDIVTGYFYDGGGDDFYRADGLALGASSQNGFGIFWDHGGDNVFRAGSALPWHGRHTVGRGGPAEYACGRLARNFGIFLSTGGGKNQYPRVQRRNNQSVYEEGHGIFVDE